MTKNILRIILIILILCWMYVVFGFSSANGEKSSGTSLKIARLFSKDEEVISKIEPIIRKIGHLSEYALDGLFLTFDRVSVKLQVVLSGIIRHIVCNYRWNSSIIYSSEDQEK